MPRINQAKTFGGINYATQPWVTEQIQAKVQIYYLSNVAEGKLQDAFNGITGLKANDIVVVTGNYEGVYKVLTVPSSGNVTYELVTDYTIATSIKSAIEALDVATVGSDTAGAYKVVTSIGETDGKISATVQDLKAGNVWRTATTDITSTTVEAALEEINSKTKIDGSATQNSIGNAVYDILDITHPTGGGQDTYKIKASVLPEIAITDVFVKAVTGQEQGYDVSTAQKKAATILMLIKSAITKAGVQKGDIVILTSTTKAVAEAVGGTYIFINNVAAKADIVSSDFVKMYVPAGTVVSVNNQTPDASGNVTVGWANIGDGTISTFVDTIASSVHTISINGVEIAQSAKVAEDIASAKASLTASKGVKRVSDDFQLDFGQTGTITTASGVTDVIAKIESGLSTDVQVSGTYKPEINGVYKLVDKTATGYARVWRNTSDEYQIVADEGMWLIRSVSSPMPPIATTESSTEDPIGTWQMSGSTVDIVTSFVRIESNTLKFNNTGVQTAITYAVTTAIEGLDVAEVGAVGKFIQSISETDGKITAVAEDLKAEKVAYGSSSTVKAELDKIEGDASTTGSIAKAVADEDTAIKAILDGGTSTYTSTSTVKAAIEAVDTKAEANKTAIGVEPDPTASPAVAGSGILKRLYDLEKSTTALETALDVETTRRASEDTILAAAINGYNQKAVEVQETTFKWTSTEVAGENVGSYTSTEKVYILYVLDSSGVQVFPEITYASDGKATLVANYGTSTVDSGNFKMVWVKAITSPATLQHGDDTSVRS